MPPTTPQDRKRKTSKAAAPDRYAPTVWGNKDFLEDLVVPSGQTCLVRRPGVQRLMEAGVLRQVDTLASIVAEEHIKRVKGEEPEIDTDSLAKDEDALISIMDVVDRVMVHCVVKPEIVMAPTSIDDRVGGVIYSDMIDIEDKMFIFNFAVGGSRSVEQFRQESLAAMGGVDDVQDAADEAKPDLLHT